VGGAPYGGACLPKDTNGLLGLARAVGVEMPLLKAAVTVNEDMAALAEPVAPAAVREEIDLTDPLPAPAAGRRHRA
jgi:UDP-glucose 6-dehydrogenase